MTGEPQISQGVGLQFAVVFNVFIEEEGNDAR